MNNDDDQTIMIKTYNMLLLLAEILFLILKVVYYICEDVYRLIVPTKKKSVAGEIVLITGAGHGIGKELAIGYASLGATVVCWDINEETNNETMNDIKRMGKDSVYAYRCNVADRKEVFRVAEKVKKEVGDVTILVNNAGIGIIKSFLNHSLDEIERVINVNATAHFWTLKAFLPSMIEKNHGHIVAVSSIAGLIGAPYGTVYCPSKFAVKDTYAKARKASIKAEEDSAIDTAAGETDIEKGRKKRKPVRYAEYDNSEQVDDPVPKKSKKLKYPSDDSSDEEISTADNIKAKVKTLLKNKNQFSSLCRLKKSITVKRTVLPPPSYTESCNASSQSSASVSQDTCVEDDENSTVKSLFNDTDMEMHISNTPKDYAYRQL